jgi:uncharacterized protein (DUF2062 family)
MNTKEETDSAKSSIPRQFWKRIHYWKNRVKNFQGDPHFVAMGMAIGVFVAATPSMPFQTAIAVALAFILRSSKAAAAIAVWLSNPITFPVFYLTGYKVGILLFGISGVDDPGGDPVGILKQGAEITIAVVTGGIIIGLCLAVATYFITRKIYTKIRSCEKLNQNDACENRL